MVRRAQQHRRRRRIQAGIGAFLAVAVLAVGTAWLMGAFDPAPVEPEAVDRCQWQDLPDPERVDVGTPPANPPTTGVRTVTVDLDAGGAGTGQVEIEASVDAEPCGVASLEHLASSGFYDGTVCHELTAEGALRCGDPSGTGEGGPTYSFYGQNFPYPTADVAPTEGAETEAPEETEPEVLYPAGTVALADTLGANSSQFLIFYQDYAPESPVWPIVGTVTGGLDLIEAIGAAGVDGEAPAPPVEEVRIESLTVADPEGGSGESDQS
jgi:peptidyl-prolyl cis-trans isomerase B (cyclophilin B)